MSACLIAQIGTHHKERMYRGIRWYIKQIRNIEIVKVWRRTKGSPKVEGPVGNGVRDQLRTRLIGWAVKELQNKNENTDDNPTIRKMKRRKLQFWEKMKPTQRTNWRSRNNLLKTQYHSKHGAQIMTSTWLQKTNSNIIKNVETVQTSQMLPPPVVVEHQACQ